MLTIRNILHYYAQDCLDLIEFGKGILDPDGIKRYENSAYRGIRRRTKKMEEVLLKKIMTAIGKIDPAKVESINKQILTIEELIERYAIRVSLTSTDEVYKHSKKAYKAAKKAMAKKFDMPYTFIHVDEVAIERINKHQYLFVEDRYGKDVAKTVEKTIRKTIEETKTLDRKAIARKLDKKMPGLVRQKGYFETVVGQVINSSRSYSSMRFYDEAKIESYLVISVLDERTSQQCKFMDGKVLNVQKTLRHYEKLDQCTSKEEVKKVNPWIEYKNKELLVNGKVLTGDLSGPDLQAMGLNAPPYHAKCRTTVAASF